MKGLGHCLMQAVNYSASNEIKLIKAIKSNKKPYRSQINRSLHVFLNRCSTPTSLEEPLFCDKRGRMRITIIVNSGYKDLVRLIPRGAKKEKDVTRNNKTGQHRMRQHTVAPD
ncbi:hypothetical protein EXN66_Car007855 [Channa argus]|uniref:Uncharacterized protein n=1 Tax=Channa argus TaxID=215402 RepID=A0A6G1PPM9_CHAAH|nr:hypothetical protein EXN66_Car007855 [Channa argus]